MTRCSRPAIRYTPSQALSVLHDPVFETCDTLYPTATAARTHVVAMKDLLTMFSQKASQAEEAVGWCPEQPVPAARRTGTRMLGEQILSSPNFTTSVRPPGGGGRISEVPSLSRSSS